MLSILRLENKLVILHKANTNLWCSLRSKCIKEVLPLFWHKEINSRRLWMDGRQLQWRRSGVRSCMRCCCMNIRAATGVGWIICICWRVDYRQLKMWIEREDKWQATKIFDVTEQWTEPQATKGRAAPSSQCYIFCHSSHWFSFTFLLQYMAMKCWLIKLICTWWHDVTTIVMVCTMCKCILISSRNFNAWFS